MDLTNLEHLLLGRHDQKQKGQRDGVLCLTFQSQIGQLLLKHSEHRFMTLDLVSKTFKTLTSGY